jgi:hypothetical protein
MELESGNDVAIFYATAISKSGDSEQVQVLLVTIVDLPTRATFLVVHWPDSERQMDIYSAQLQIAQDTGCPQTVIAHRIEPGNHQFVETERFVNITSSSRSVMVQLSNHRRNRSDYFHVTWTGDSLNARASFRITFTELMSELRKLTRFGFYNFLYIFIPLNLRQDLTPQRVGKKIKVWHQSIKLMPLEQFGSEQCRL